MKTQRKEGYVESLAALALQYTISVYLHDWSYFYNALIIYLGAIILSRKIASKYVVYSGLALYFGLICQSRIEFALNLACYCLLNDSGLSFCDTIVLTQLLYNYCWMGLQKIVNQQAFASQMISNEIQIFIFLPWVFLFCISIGGKVMGV